MTTQAPEQGWPQVKQALRGTMTRATYEWLWQGAALIPEQSDVGRWTVQVQHPAAFAWVTERIRYARLLEVVRQVVGQPVLIRIIVAQPPAGGTSNPPEPQTPAVVETATEAIVIPLTHQGQGPGASAHSHGDTLMDDQRQRVRIVSHVTKSTFLHVEDAQGIGKLRLFGGSYRKGQGAEHLLVHYLDIPDARVVLRALVDGLDGYTYKEFKGTPLEGGKALSRVLAVQVKEGKVFVELTQGPGTLTATGAVTPSRAKDPAISHVQVTVACTLHQAQRVAEETLAYLQACDVVRAWQQHQQLGVLPAFTLVAGMRVGEPSGGRADEVTEEEVATQGRTPLRYANQEAVNLGNAEEVAAFQHYRQAQRRVPASKAALRGWVTQRRVA